MPKLLREVIAVRSLTGSDLGLFAAHRGSATSKQRAININTAVAAQLLSPAAFRAGGVIVDCYCTFRDLTDMSKRHLGKAQKNWRLGGQKLEGAEFAAIDTLDFALIRSMQGNKGNLPISISFISRNANPSLHRRLAAVVGPRLKQSMAVYEQRDKEFRLLASVCPIAPDPSFEEVL